MNTQARVPASTPMDADMPTHVEVEDDDDSGRMASGDVEMSGFAPDFFEVRASLLCGRLARL